MRGGRFPGSASGKALNMKEVFTPRCSPDLGELAKEVVRTALERAAATFSPYDILLAVDGTCGNGRDTLFLAQTLLRLRPEGKTLVLSFDVQADALATARKRLDSHCPTADVRFTAAGHETLAVHLPSEAVFLAAMYNLGFLPGSDKRVVTLPETTLRALQSTLEHLRPGGVCAVHAYGGHAGGGEELRAVENFFAELPFDAFSVARYSFCNKPRNPEVLFLAEKR